MEANSSNQIKFEIELRKRKDKPIMTITEEDLNLRPDKILMTIKKECVDLKSWFYLIV